MHPQHATPPRDTAPRITIRGPLAAPPRVNNNTYGQVWIELLVQQRLSHRPDALPIYAKYYIERVEFDARASFSARREAAHQLAAQLHVGLPVTMTGCGIDTHEHLGAKVLRLGPLEELHFATLTAVRGADYYGRRADSRSTAAEAQAW